MQTYYYIYLGNKYNNKKEMIEALNITRRRWASMIKKGQIIQVDL